jgi:ABC-2 type transport system permease protein
MMLKVLLKKQLAEVFRSYFFDAKKNRMRSRGAVVGWFFFFFVIMVGVLGGLFTALALSMCGGLALAGMDWLYFLLMGGLAIILGAFGSVFNTYSSLYLSKDNDLLLSLPIPVRYIIAARLLNVYLMGTMYAATAILPALIVYWAVVGFTVSRFLCGLLLFVIVSFIVLLLSCLLGWVAAKVSRKLKNRSFITVFIAVLFIAAYYFIYFKANDMIRDVIRNAELYGARIKGAAYGLFMFGQIGAGDWFSALLFTLLTALLCCLCWLVLTRSFLSIAAAGGGGERVRYREKAVRGKSAGTALLVKELGRFTSSPSYMLNCGLPILLLPALGIFLLFKGRELSAAVNAALAGRQDTAAMLTAGVLCMLAAMNNMATPAVSLEGKCIWIPQSLPLRPRDALRAKAAMQLILTAVPLLFAAVCAVVVLEASPAAKLCCILLPLGYAFYSAMFGTAVGTRLPLLSWTTELAPIKQSAAVAITIFGGWAIILLLGGLYLAFGHRLGAAAYMGLWTLAFAAAGCCLLRWLDTKGAAIFAGL